MLKEIKLQGEKYYSQEKWLLITAEYRGDLYVVEELNCLGSGAIYPTRFKGVGFSPDKEHVNNISMKVFDSKEAFEKALNKTNYTTY